MPDRAEQIVGDAGKDPHGFTRLKTSLEPATMALGVDQTPIDRFFVCSAGPAVHVDVAAWRLTVGGSAATRPIELSLADLQALPQATVDSWLECAGNGRRLYELVGGYERSAEATDTQWLTGAMGMARWSGVRLADVIALVEPTASLSHVGPAGLDAMNEEGETVRMSLPIEKALDPDTLIALEMNGAPLLAAHGAPARMLVPGWIGAYSVKWLDQIELSDRWIPSWRADTYYRRRDEQGADLGPATAHPVKSNLALDWEASLPAGPQRLRGYARGGAEGVSRVQWSLDGGPWVDAALEPLPGTWSWTPFVVEVDLPPGPHQVRTRATDRTGTTQPEMVPYHPNTVLWNAVIPHPVTAA